MLAVRWVQEARTRAARSRNAARVAGFRVAGAETEAFGADVGLGAGAGLGEVVGTRVVAAPDIGGTLTTGVALGAATAPDVAALDIVGALGESVAPAVVEARARCRRAAIAPDLAPL